MPKLQKWGVSGTEGRHFYCSKECFTSSWAVHKELHVWKERTIILDTDGHNCSIIMILVWQALVSCRTLSGMIFKRHQISQPPSWRKSLRRRICCREKQGSIMLEIRCLEPAGTPAWT
mmetsp:Transcript_44640/g.71636  ORF Transcript_44640/g.71636 Transcript_44640/m.71636 type:complete len:118 (-) Transcript_44640:1274-1627(-)